MRWIWLWDFWLFVTVVGILLLSNEAADVLSMVEFLYSGLGWVPVIQHTV